MSDTGLVFAAPVDYIQALNMLGARIVALTAIVSPPAGSGGGGSGGSLFINDGEVLADISGASATAVGVALTDVFDHDLGNTDNLPAVRIGGTWSQAVLPGLGGGTGVANSGKTITLGGNLTTSGAFATTLTVTAATNSTLPSGTHTLAGLDVAQTWTANQTLSGAGLLEPYSYNTPLTGATITMAAYERRCIINPAGTLAALTVNLPPNPVDGQVAGVATTQIVTALTVAAGTGGASIVGAPTTLAADATFTMLYRSASTTWYLAP